MYEYNINKLSKLNYYFLISPIGFNNKSFFNILLIFDEHDLQLP